MSTPETKLVNIVLTSTITKHLKHQQCLRVPVDATQEDILRFGAKLQEGVDGGSYRADGKNVINLSMTDGALAVVEPLDLAEQEFQVYDFAGSEIVGIDGWDTSDPADITRVVYAKHPDDAPDASSNKVSFHVRLDDNGMVDEVYALDVDTGNEFGQRGASQGDPQPAPCTSA